MKLALRYIPTEVWVDVFCYPWKSRKELGKIVDNFRNRYFAEILQYCLHERGKRMLEELHLNETLFGIPRTPMPDNIKFFEKIAIRYFDSQSLDFLRRISELFLFNEVNLDLEFFESEQELANLPTIFDHLAPLLHGINSIAFDQAAIPLVVQYFGPRLAQVKQLTLFLDPSANVPFDPATNQAVNFCLNWLTSEDRDPAEPKFLEVYFCSGVYQQFSMAVEQQFQSAKRPSTFVVKFHCRGHEHDFQQDLENNIGEQLHGHFDEENGDFWIFRHPAGSNRAQLEEWVENLLERSDKSSVIKFFPDMTIGQIDSDAGANEVDENAGEEEDGPSTSKKPKQT